MVLQLRTFASADLFPRRPDDRFLARSGNKTPASGVIILMDESLPWRAPAPAAFEQTMLPHLDAAYNLARWLLRHDQDAEDCVQEACLLAFKAFGRFRGGDGRAHGC